MRRSRQEPYWLGACVDPVDGESSTSNNCSEGIPIRVIESIPEQAQAVSLDATSAGSYVRIGLRGLQAGLTATVQQNGGTGVWSQVVPESGRLYLEVPMGTADGLELVLTDADGTVVEERTLPVDAIGAG